MLGQLVAAQFDIETAIADMMRDGAPASAISDSRSQLGTIVALRQQIAGADVKTLAALRSDIATAIASSQSAAQQARAAVDASNASSITTIAQNARTAVNDVMHGMKDFDPYLNFASPEDEAAYRKREAERRAYIAAEQAKHTPQGDLYAGGGALGQMIDAAAHGASRSPEFQRRWDKLSTSMEVLRAQVQRDGGNVGEFDARLRDDMRTIMRSKAIPETQIEALLAAHQDNPLDAMKAFVADQKGVISEKEMDDLSRKAQNYKENADEKTVLAPPSVEQAALVDAISKFRASGVSLSDDPAPLPTTGHATSASNRARAP